MNPSGTSGRTELIPFAADQERNEFRSTTARADILFHQHQQEIFKRTDRLFAGLLAFQWLSAIVVSLWISPLSWAGQYSQTHQHVWAALLLGGGIVSFPIGLALWRPGRTATRHTIAAAQMLMGALLIHLTGGRIETHFHVFGSLAFLAFYRDWRVLITASVVVAGDHFVRGTFWSLSVFGVASASPWRWLEHAGWVVFEDLFLILACLRGVKEMLAMAMRQAEVEAANARTEQQVKERTAALQASEARFRALTDLAPVGVFLTDLGGQCLYVNDCWSGLTGLREEDALGVGWKAALHPEDRERIAAAWQYAVDRGQAFSAEYRYLSPTGRTVWVWGNANPMVSESADVTGYVGAVLDITERIQATDALKSAVEAAESANRAKSEFLANMSHEIRTPMNGIIGMTGLALDTELTSEQREYITAVQISADALLTVINDILDFSKIEAGKLDLEATDFAVRDTIGSTMKALALRAHDKGLELACQLPAELPETLIGDSGRLRQILLNLLGNALKFTERGEVVLSAEVEARTKEDIQLHFTVRDTGIGIPADKQKSIFEAFTQADGSTTRKYGGTGLGLSICVQLVELMGGRIWVESDVGVGSAFHFTVRFGVSAAPASRPSRPPPKLNDMPVLVVDDNATNRRILKELLQRWHMKPTLADSGAAAMTALQEAAAAGGRFGLILLDAHMPEMDGFTLAQHIQQHREFARPTMMMLTSGNQRADAARCRELGISSYLVKPIQQAELLAAIIMALRISMQGQQKVLEQAKPDGIAKNQRQLRVLLAEDNRVNQMVATRFLEKQGYQVHVTGNGREALKILDEEPFDIVLMDVQMPEMDGFETTAAIRAREAATGEHVPIIAMTAHAMKGDRERCIKGGMDGYVSKPIQADELHEAMESLLISAAPTEPGVVTKPENKCHVVRG